MTQDELYESKSIAVDSYGGGFILADYSGNRGEASYCGVSMSWSLQPIVRDPFPTVEAAVAAGVDA
jgi:hypothetical protein